jgi:DUF971 family protein
MSSPATTIQRADIDGALGQLLIDWADGRRCVYPLALLRAECPCATCRSLRETTRAAAADPFRVIPGELLQPNSAILDVEPVGRYGMRIRWGDGHATGIYTFEYLRELGERPEVRQATAERNRDAAG